MIVVAFHVPTVYPDGNQIHPHFVESLLNEVADFAGGLSLFEGLGAWRNPDDGDWVREPILRIVVGVEEQQVNSLLTLIVDWLKGPFHQQAVWIEIDGTPEIR